MLNLIANDVTQEVKSYNCIITAKLTDYPTLASVSTTITIIITDCLVTNIAVSDAPSTL